MMVIAWIAMVINILLLICSFIVIVGGDTVGKRLSSCITFTTTVMNIYFVAQYIYG